MDKPVQGYAQIQHQPVLYREVLQSLHPVSGGYYVDGTLGAGGHARGILTSSQPDGQLLGLDVDPVALDLAQNNLAEFSGRCYIRQASYTDITKCMAGLNWKSADGILLDLGISSMQVDDPNRGFSFRFEAPLDMRFSKSANITAADLVNLSSEDDLLHILWEYGEEQQARRIVTAIIAARPIKSTVQLANLIEKTIGRRLHIHPATRTFQALRIAVNGELENIAKVLPLAIEMLSPTGRLAVITFHSLEDRIVKHFFQRESKDCLCPPELPVCRCGHRASIKIVKPAFMIAGDEEIQTNPRSRSARLRVVEKLSGMTNAR